MKKILQCFVAIFFLVYGIGANCQTITADQIKQKIQGMTPAQIMQYQKQLQQQILQQQAKKLPNGQQLPQTRHFENTFTTVQFSYHRRMTSSSNGVEATEESSCSGTSGHAPMQYDANGYANVRCNMTAIAGADSRITQMANGLDQYKQYMAPEQAVQANDASRTLSFSSSAMSDHSLTGEASLHKQVTSPDGNSETTSGAVTNIIFSFFFDPVQNFGTFSAGTSFTQHVKGTHLGVPFKRDEQGGVSVAAKTDPSQARLAGAGMLNAVPGEVYMTVSKSPNGYTISYTRNEELNEVHGHVTETLTATIGGPVQQYEAILMPMPESKYETWLPKGPKVDGSDDTKGDDSLKFYVIVRDKNDHNKRYPGNFTVDYKLSDITHYKGFNSNYPVENANEGNDFKICDSLFIPPLEMFDRNTATDTTVATLPGKGALAVVQLSCMDYGAWAKLSAKVTLDDGSAPLTAHPYYSDLDLFITAPFDKDKNKLADYWEKRENIFNSGYGLDWDEDVKPNNHHNGDNIPLIDEYRGFLTEDDNYKPVYKRFSPQTKELITIGPVNKGGDGAVYKSAIALGVWGYTKISGVQAYHLTNSKYGKQEPAQTGLPYGRWVNYNTPLKHVVRGIVIVADNMVRNPPDGVVASTVPVGGAPLADVNKGALFPEDTKDITIWTNNVDKTAYKPGEYLPANPNPNDPNVIRKNGYLIAANKEFGVNIDPLHASDLVSMYYTKNLSRIITFTVAHELCHATHIHHHHLTQGDDGSYFGVANCPVRYFLNNFNPVNCSTWVAMYITGNWNPATLSTPWGVNQPMQLCTTEDDCFSQLQLKKH